MNHALGGCSKSEADCRYAHRATLPHEEDQVKKWRENRAAKGKGKAKAKAKAKAAPATLAAMALLSLPTAMAHWVGRSVGTGGDTDPAGATLIGLGRRAHYRLSAIDEVEFELPEDAVMDQYFRRLHSGEHENQNCWGDPEYALAGALRRAKDAARAVGYTVDYGWPVVWEENYVHYHYPDPRGIAWIAFGNPVEPVHKLRAAAILEFVDRATDPPRDHLHFGEYSKQL